MPLVPQPEDLEAPKTHHFKVKTFKKVKPCGICRQVITREGCTCKGEQLVGPGGWEYVFMGMRSSLGSGQGRTQLCQCLSWGPDLVLGSHLRGDAEHSRWQAWCVCVCVAHGK